MTDAQGQIVWDVDRKPFGEVSYRINLATNNLRFPGQYADEETGLHYNYFRDYDPGTGRYIQSDPIGLNGGINTYVYVGGNPLMEIDLFGLQKSFSETMNWLGSQLQNDLSSAASSAQKGLNKGKCISVCYVVGYAKGSIASKAATEGARKAGLQTFAKIIPVVGNTWTALSTSRELIECSEQCNEDENQCK
ncbi:MAG: RHS repeat-associated core domain-containing protein [Imperialibacter sp.]